MSESRSGPLAYADLALDPVDRRAWRAGRELELTRTQFDLLEMLLSHPGRVLARARLAARVCTRARQQEVALNVHVHNLRRATEAGGACRLVQTVRGVGVVLRAAP